MTPSPGFLHLAWTQFNEENHEKKYKIIAFKTVYVHAKLPQSCSTLCNPMDCSLPGSSVHGILQARIMEWVVMLSSRGSSLEG